ncbi:MAG: sugar phosphate isomerase/epimerase family protein [Alkalispirochaetaceae bacterium]
MKFGVSPAYMISRWGEGFTAEQQAESLREIARLGFDAFQPEVFYPERLRAWVIEGAPKVAEMAERTRLVASQLVGHFLLHGFDSIETLRSDFGIEEAGRFAETKKLFVGCEVITLPLPVFAPVETERKELTDPSALRQRLVEKLKRVATAVSESGGKLALELMPYALLGGTGALKALLNELPESVGFNFDTGHAWACKERIELVPGTMGRKLLGTHLCDNEGFENRSDRPGAGTIPWPATIRAIQCCGYDGSYDLEIRCSPKSIPSEYGRGLQLLKTLLQQLT